MDKSLAPGQVLARGVARHLRTLNFTTLLEYVPTKGLRVDVVALGPKGEIWIVECKSSKADFQSDNKWQGYLDWCDGFYWAVPTDFPTDLLPSDTGLIFCDGYGADIITSPPDRKLPAARRKKITLDCARTAARRLQNHLDPKI